MIKEIFSWFVVGTKSSRAEKNYSFELKTHTWIWSLALPLISYVVYRKVGYYHLIHFIMGKTNCIIGFMEELNEIKYMTL